MITKWQIFGKNLPKKQPSVKQTKTRIRNKTELSETEYVWGFKVFCLRQAKNGFQAFV